MFDSVYMKALMGTVAGAAIGIVYSRLTRCSTGACPITSNWWLAGLYGAALGMFVMLSSTGTSAAPAATGGQRAAASQTRPAATQPQGEMKMTKHVDSVADFDREVLQSAKPVLVDFYAVWCGPCRFLTPILDQIVAEQGDRVDIVKVDVDKVMELAARYRIQGVPTVMLFDGGKPVRTFVGVRPRAEYLSAISQTVGARQ